MQATRTSLRTRLHSTSGNVSVDYPGGESGSKELFQDLFPATHDTSKPSGHGSKTTILNPKQQSETTVQNEAETKQHKTIEAECEKRTRKTKVKTKTLKMKQNPARQSGGNANNQRDAHPLARREFKQRPPFLTGDPDEIYAQTPPAARRETPFGEQLGAGLRTPASASYEEHNHGDRGMSDRTYVTITTTPAS